MQQIQLITSEDAGSTPAASTILPKGNALYSLLNPVYCLFCFSFRIRSVNLIKGEKNAIFWNRNRVRGNRYYRLMHWYFWLRLLCAPLFDNEILKNSTARATPSHAETNRPFFMLKIRGVGFLGMIKKL